MGRAKVIPPETKFLSYQKRWIEDGSRLKLMEKARQIGLSWATSYAAVARTAVAGAKFDQWVSSRDDLQARLFLEDCKNFAQIIDTGARDLGAQVIDDEKKLSAYVLHFASGKRIHSMSSNPDAQAGKRGGRILDEFALHPDPRKLWSIAYPGITWGGSMEIISTHRGSDNPFNQLVKEIKEKGNPKGISLHTVTLQNALDAGFLAKLQGKLPKDDPRQDMDEAAYYDFIRQGCLDEESFLQEFCCVPADDTTAFLTYDQIATCAHKEPRHLWEWPEQVTEEVRKQAATYPVFVGVDIGRTKDLTAIWIAQKIAGRLILRRLITLQDCEFSKQEAILYPWLEIARRACIDASGLGRHLAENARKKFGSKVEPVVFTAQVKEELAYPFRAAFEDLTITISDDRALTTDLRAVKKVQTAAGHVRFSADRGPGGHADRFWAGALCWHAQASGLELAVGRSISGLLTRRRPALF